MANPSPKPAIVNLLVKPGDNVEADQDLIEVETNKATMTVRRRAAGKIEKFTAQLNESYAVGAVLGQIEATKEEAARLGLDVAPAKTSETEQLSKSDSNRRSGRVQPTVRGLPVPANAAGASYLSPRLKARMDELGLHAADLAGVAGSGAAGRVTVEDFEKFIAQPRKAQNERRVVHARGRGRRDAAQLDASACDRRFARRARRRSRAPEKFKSKTRPGALCVARAGDCARGKFRRRRTAWSAIKLFIRPRLTSALPSRPRTACLFPSLRDADKKSLTELVARYNELVELARQRKLPADATGGSIATVTNYGTFGLIWATPIPLPEQTLVLGMGAGRRAPHWDEAKKQFVPVMEANLTLSFDHRVLDGGAAGRLLSRIADLMSRPEKL